MERVFFDRDLLTEYLLPLLPLYDVFSLFETHPGFHRAYKRKYNEPSSTFHMFNLRIQRALTQFYGEENMRILMTLMTDGSLRLTGGLLLAIINAENIFDCEDADFVCDVGRIRDGERSKYVGQICRSLKSANYVETPLNFYQNVFSVDTLNVNGKKLQIVSIRTKLGKYLDEFDFSFCANCYGTGKLLISSKESIVKKISDVYLAQKYGTYYIRNQRILDNGKKRILKYRKKGYFINIKDRRLPITHTKFTILTWDKFWYDV